MSGAHHMKTQKSSANRIKTTVLALAAATALTGCFMSPMFMREEVADRIARPCQYSGWKKEGSCPDLYWTNGRFSPEVIAAYHDTLNNIKAMYKITGFNLVGYSGGAAIAAILAGERDDVLSLRTVAGNLDHEAWTQYHKISPLDQSINPVTYAAKDAHIPQHHFIGGRDTIVPPSLVQNWRQASGPTDCVHYTLIPENDHEKGWVEKWPELLKADLSCTPPAQPEPAPVPQEFYDAGKGKSWKAK